MSDYYDSDGDSYPYYGGGYSYSEGCVCADTEESYGCSDSEDLKQSDHPAAFNYERSSQSKNYGGISSGGHKDKQVEVAAPRAGLQQEWSFKESHEERDKQSGSYARSTAKDIISIGQEIKERSTGRVGVKNEVKSTSTFRVGDKTGYAEYQIEERLKRVDFGGATSNKGNHCGPANNKYLK